MTQSTRRFKIWTFMLAGLIGLSLGSREFLSGFFIPNAESPAHDGIDASPDEAGSIVDRINASDKAMSSPQTTSTALESGSQIRAADGLIFEPTRRGATFVGYRAITNIVDGRFATGDIVTAINGVRVEDSAAGSELFIAALSDPNAKVTVFDGGSQDDSN